MNYFFQELNKGEKKEWDQLVEKNEGSLFSLSTFLEATAENWCVLYNENKTGGMVCAFTKRLGIEILYTPFFIRYAEWIGEKPDFQVVKKLLKDRFKVATFHFKSFAFGGIERVHQELNPSELRLSDLAKRSLKKANTYQVFREFLPEKLMKCIQQELSKKVATLNPKTLPLLEKVAVSFPDSEQIQFNIYEGEDWKGAAWFIENDRKVYYIKGACEKDVKSNGGMYMLIFQGILYAQEKNKIFDFGGSNVATVREFNIKFGSKDKKYAHVTWNEAPAWWTFLQKMKKLVKK